MAPAIRHQCVLTKRVCTWELGRERHLLALRQALDKAQRLALDMYAWTGKTHVLAGNGLDDVVGRRSEELGDNGELVDVYVSVRGFWIVRNSRSLPGNRGLPSSISAKMQPVLQMSTATSYFCQVSMISGAR